MLAVRKIVTIRISTGCPPQNKEAVISNFIHPHPWLLAGGFLLRFVDDMRVYCGHMCI